MILKKNYYFDILILFLIFILDRFSKIYVIYLSEKNNYSKEYIKGVEDAYQQLIGNNVSPTRPY